MPASDLRPAVFLDRDGTLIEGEGYLARPDGVRAIPGVREALGRLRELGYVRVVATNQSGVARDYFDPHTYASVDRAVTAAVGLVEATYAAFCHPDQRDSVWGRESEWRKPAGGMLSVAAHDLRLDLTRSWLVGDDLRDLQAAVAVGVRPVLVRTGKGARNEPLLAEHGLGQAVVVDDLAAFVRTLESVGAGASA